MTSRKDWAEGDVEGRTETHMLTCTHTHTHTHTHTQTQMHRMSKGKEGTEVMERHNSPLKSVHWMQACGHLTSLEAYCGVLVSSVKPPRTGRS
jgi:hypothetical protein